MLILLAFCYAIHLFATVVWLGLLFVSALFAFPAWRMRLEWTENHWLAWQKQLFPLIQGAMVLLWLTGFVQMTQDSHYDGFLALQSGWAWAMLIKHLAVLGMMGVTFGQKWVLFPALERTQWLVQAGKSADLPALMRQNSRLLAINLICAIIVLVCTAIATAL